MEIKCDFCDDEMHFFVCVDLKTQETRYYCNRHWFEKMEREDEERDNK